MRRISGCVLAALCAAILAACGSSGAGSPAANPRLQALAYFPPSSPFVMTLETASGSSSARQLKALEQANPSYALGVTALFGRLSQLGIDYNADLRPLFGNPVAVGLGGPGGSFLLAWVTRDAAALHRLVAKLPSLRPSGHDGGAALYAGSKAALAVDGATVVAGRSVALVRAALTRRAEHQGISSAEEASATSGISPGGLFDAFGDLAGVLSRPGASSARRVPWVQAIRTYGLSLSSTGHGLTLHVVLNTDGRSLTPSELPLASGALGPSLVGPAPIEAGLRDPAQFISFVIAAMRASSPRQYAAWQRQAAALRATTGVSVATLESLLTGSLDVDSDGRSTLVRADLTRPGVVTRALARLASAPRSARLTATGRLVSVGDGFYRAQRSGQTTYVGVADGRLVAGTASLTAIREFAAAPGAAPSQGGVATARVALGQLIALGLAHSPAAASLPPVIVQRLIGAVGDLTATVQATTGGLTATATVPFHAPALGSSSRG
jgi:hypothetical protein